MKLYKQFLTATTGCLLLSAAGAAMAVDCPRGFIRETTVPSIEIDGQVCVIDDVVVQGAVTVTNSPELFMSDVDVGGPLTVTGGESAIFLRVDVKSGDFSVTGAKLAVVGANTVQGGPAPDGTVVPGGNLLVNDNIGAAVQSNAANGNITCTGNTELDAFDNIASGTINCTPN